MSTVWLPQLEGNVVPSCPMEAFTVWEALQTSKFMEVPLRRQHYLNHGWLVISLVPSLSLSLLSDVVGEERYWMEVQPSNRALVLATSLHDSYSRALWTLYWEPGTTMQVEHSEPEMLWSLNILSSGVTFRVVQVLQCRGQRLNVLWTTGQQI